MQARRGGKSRQESRDRLRLEVDLLDVGFGEGDRLIADEFDLDGVDADDAAETVARRVSPDFDEVHVDDFVGAGAEGERNEGTQCPGA